MTIFLITFLTKFCKILDKYKKQPATQRTMIANFKSKSNVSFACNATHDDCEF